MAEERENVQTESIERGDDQISPESYLSVNLEYDERLKLEKWIDGHIEQIKQDMGDILQRFEQERNQLEGVMPGADYPYPGSFRINMPVTKKKWREICNRIKQAYLDSDPVWAINTADKSLLNKAIKVEQSLDFLFDNEMDAVDDVSQALFEATGHGTGLLVPGWSYEEEVVRDVVNYKGFDGVSKESLVEVFRFEKDFPNWKDEPDARKMHSAIVQGKGVEKEVTYTAAVRNKPDYTYVPVKDARVYPHVEGIKGLRRTPIYGYVKQYTNLELEQFAEENVIDKDALRIAIPQETEENPRREVDQHMVSHLTIRYKLSEDERQARYKIWFHEEKKVILRIRAFPYWINEPDLIPFYIRQEDPGFFKKGIAWDTVDDHTALNALLNMFLNAVDMANSMRWKTKFGSFAEGMLLNRQWSPHIPLSWKTDEKEIQSMATPTNHLGPIVQGLEIMRRNVDEGTGTSALQSGRESPTDPSAPAAKTALLLQQVEPNMKEYIRSLEPSFRLLGKWTLMLYYQAVRLGWIESVPGAEDIPPEQLKDAAEKLFPRALLFEFDRGGRQQRNIMLLDRASAMLGQARPDVVMKMFRIILSEDPYWSRIVDTLGLDEMPMQLPPSGVPAQPNPQVNPQPGGNGVKPRQNPSEVLLGGRV